MFFWGVFAVRFIHVKRGEEVNKGEWGLEPNRSERKVSTVGDYFF